MMRMGGGLRQRALKPKDSFVELLSFDPNQWMDGFTSARQSRSIWRAAGDEQQNIYEDYPLLYFSERQWKLSGDGEEEEGEGNEDDTEEEEEDTTFFSELESMTGGGGSGLDKIGGKESSVKKLTREESEYDGGSEGGESDQSKSRVKTQQSLYTPRSDHDKKHKSKSQSQRSQGQGRSK